MALTVTATLGSAGGGGTLRLKVLNGAKPVALQTGGGKAQSTAAPVTYDQAGTILSASSVVYGACSNFSSATSFTADAQTTMIDNLLHSGTGDTDGTFRSTGTTGGTGSKTYGCTGPTSTTGSVAWAEVLAATTITEDASSPAVVDNTTAGTLITASFDPPRGSLLVAMVAAVFGTGNATCVMSNDGTPLKWTTLNSAALANQNGAFVFIADILPDSTPQRPMTGSWG